MDLTRDDILGAVARLLETDRLLGVRHVPLQIAVGGAAPSPTAVRPVMARPQVAAAPRRPVTPAPSVAPARPIAAMSTGTPPVARAGAQQKSANPLQLISDAELRRRQRLLDEMNETQVRVCQKCGLHRTRKNTVFGQGNPAARLVFVGEAPGADEDEQGLAFVGRAGQLLTQMIAAMGLTRDQVFICNILKCRPPDNRVPNPEEVAACWPYLDAQLRIIQPEVIVALGKSAAQTLLRTTESIGRLRGQWHDYYTSGMPSVGEPTALMPTYHPAYLLRTPGDKGKAWHDLQMVIARMGLPLPKRNG